MIRIRGLTVTLGGRSVLQNLDLDLRKGESSALVGPNGAGKTTVLRCLVGLLRYEGSISVDGIDIRRDPIGAKRLLGYMPQVPAFCEETARGALTFVARLRGVSLHEVPEWLEVVGLSDHAHRRVDAFSMGMKQRLSLAAALLGSPPVLVLDEPTASLDLRGQRQLVQLLGELAEDGRTLLLSSHRSEEIAALASRIVVLDEGRVVASGPVEEVSASIWGPQDARGPRGLEEEIA
ncbi:MAG: ABC transporter ATP-binding protein [Planctomycetota bacterium]|nr:MAG: ABC transporter ATP-binding protein [Planctomycetota bacterium]